jgi:O-methyltransferase involved in polyketide biosynthesis
MPSSSAPSEEGSLAPTAHYTAYVWHRVGLPHAELFATRLGAALFWGFHPLGHVLLPRLGRGTPTMTQYLELRHRGIDGALDELEPDLAVELGAGLSRRGVTWAERGTRYVEVDLASMVALKRSLLEARASRALRARLGGLSWQVADVRAPAFEGELARLLWGAARPVVVAEGLLGYFALDDVSALAGRVARVLEGRGAFVFELRSEEDDAGMGFAVKVVKATIALGTRGRGTRRDFIDAEALRRCFLDAGFAEVEALKPDRVPHLAHVRPPTRVWVARGRA